MREREHLESQGRGVYWHFECSQARLKHLAVSGHRQVQHGVGNHALRGEERVQPRKPDGALSGDSFCGVWRKTSVHPNYQLNHLYRLDCYVHMSCAVF